MADITPLRGVRKGMKLPINHHIEMPTIFATSNNLVPSLLHPTHRQKEHCSACKGAYSDNNTTDFHLEHSLLLSGKSVPNIIAKVISFVL